MTSPDLLPVLAVAPTLRALPNLKPAALDNVRVAKCGLPAGPSSGARAFFLSSGLLQRRSVEDGGLPFTGWLTSCFRRAFQNSKVTGGNEGRLVDCAWAFPTETTSLAHPRSLGALYDPNRIPSTRGRNVGGHT